MHFPRYSSSRHWIGNARTKAHVRPSPIVVFSPFSKQPSQVPLTERNEPIQTLSPQAPDQPFAKGIRFWRSNGSLENSNSKGLDAAVQIHRENTRPIADQPTVSVVTGDGFPELLLQRQSRRPPWPWRGFARRSSSAGSRVDGWVPILRANRRGWSLAKCGCRVSEPVPMRPGAAPKWGSLEPSPR